MSEQTGQLKRPTVNLIPSAYSALLEAAKATGDTQADTVNRALQLYAFYTKQAADGWEPALVRDGKVCSFALE